MSKRTHGHEPRERDEYTTPWKAVVPLLRLLEPGTRFIEPCAGPGELVEHLEVAGHICDGFYDLPIDARSATYAIGAADAVFVTNPPWRHQFGPFEIIANLSDQRPLWALVPSDWLFNVNALPWLPRLHAIAAIGRVKWIADSAHGGGYENSCWCLFGRPGCSASPTIRFHGRGPARARLKT
jgi:hypothetical protein